jgi:serine protease Do
MSVSESKVTDFKSFSWEATLSKRLKIAVLLMSLFLLAGFLTVAGCGSEKAVSESQVADYNEPGVVYVVTTYDADVTVPVLDVDIDGLINYVAGQVLAGAIPNDENEMLFAAVNELLDFPELYVVPTSQTDTRPMEVSSSGNGFIISPDGYMVTNAHLIKESEDDLKYSMAKEAATSAILDELDAFENGLGFTLTQDDADRFLAAGLSVYADYLTVGKVDSKTQVYTGDIIDKARDGEKGLAAETIKLGDPLDIQEETGKDIAILKINGSNLPTLNLGDEGSVRDGDKVMAVSFISSKSEEGSAGYDIPKEDKPSLVTGNVSGRRQMEGGWNVLQLQIPLHEGSSGSPILNSDGDVVGVETFGTVVTDESTGAETDLETQNYAIPVSIVKDFLSQSNVSASQGNATAVYREGVDLFSEDHYSAAKSKFEEVKGVNPDFPYIQDFITESQANIDKGLDKGTFPTLLVIVLVAAAVFVVAVILIVVLVIMPRSGKKGQGPGAPGGMPGGPGAPGGGMPGGPGPETGTAAPGGEPTAPAPTPPPAETPPAAPPETGPPDIHPGINKPEEG